MSDYQYMINYGKLSLHGGAFFSLSFISFCLGYGI
jgi:hypothetical protein